MSDTRITSQATTPRPDVRAAIARAAQKTGVDFDFLLAQARLESSLDPTARAGTSSAAGLYQFTGGTWLDTLRKHGDEHGLGWAADPAQRAPGMALRFDADASALMAAELAGDNAAALQTTLGRTPDASELYLAHFLGAEGAGRFLTALAADPGQSATALFPEAAAANRGVFNDAAGSPRSLGEVMGLMRGKMARAMGQGIGGQDPGGAVQFAAASAPTAPGGPIAQAFHAARAAAPQSPARASMADTLRASFALDANPAAAPAHVRGAYARLTALGL